MRGCVWAGSGVKDSVRAGLEALGGCDWVAVHDGARPLVDRAMVLRGLKAAAETGAAVCAVPAKDTIKVVSEDRRGARDASPGEAMAGADAPSLPL